MKGLSRRPWWPCVLAIGLAVTTPAAGQQTTLGGGTAGESAARLSDSYEPPTGPPPRLPDGKVDLSSEQPRIYKPNQP